MSARFEHVDTSLIDLAQPGEELGAAVVEEYALVIGDPWDCAAVIHGSLDSIEEQLERILAAVRCAQDQARRDDNPESDQRATEAR